MGTKLSYFFLLSLLFVGCTGTDSNQDTKPLDTVKIYDTVQVLQIIPSDSYKRNKNNHERWFTNAYNKIKQTPFDKNFFIKIRGNDVYVSYFITGMFYEESIIYNSVILFYLKFYFAFLNGEKYCFKVMSDQGENSFTPVFYIIFVKISGHKPEKGMLANTVYNWVLTQPEYLKNKDIKAEVDKIKLKLKEIEK